MEEKLDRKLLADTIERGLGSFLVKRAMKFSYFGMYFEPCNWELFSRGAAKVV